MPVTLNPAPNDRGRVMARTITGPQAPSLLQTPLANEDGIVDFVLSELLRLDLDFADFRLGKDLRRAISVQDASVQRTEEQGSQGIGIRVLYRGSWAHVATSQLNESGLKRAIHQAYDMAKAVAAITPDEHRLKTSDWASEPAHRDEFHTPMAICPFQVPIAELATPLIEASERGLACKYISRAVGWVEFQAYRRIYANTEGARILSTHAMVDGMKRFYATVDGQTEYRSITSGTRAGGLEQLQLFDFVGRTDDACRDAVAKSTARKPHSGHYDLILDPHNLALTMHESVGHPTELDRVLGYEFGFAGGSFARIKDLGRLQYGSQLVNFTADNTIMHGAASVGYDDEGVACRRFPVIEDGVLLGFGSNRETAHTIGQTRANGTCRAQTWKDAPIVRIPNLYLEPGKDELSLDELIADTKDGILMFGYDSFSIDQMRYNFQFGGDMCHRIENGKITEPLKGVIYQSVSTEFWNSCDAICDQSEWQMSGFVNCGKGQPMQSGRMMHGASPARFRQVRVGY